MHFSDFNKIDFWIYEIKATVFKDGIRKDFYKNYVLFIYLYLYLHLISLHCQNIYLKKDVKKNETALYSLVISEIQFYRLNLSFVTGREVGLVR